MNENLVMLPITSAYLTNTYTKIPLGTKNCDLSQGQDHVLDARKLKAQASKDELTSIVNKNLQATLYGDRLLQDWQVLSLL